jgi:hypothetical protein
MEVFKTQAITCAVVVSTVDVNLIKIAVAVKIIIIIFFYMFS